jgi:divalent metal cation (Fe/Co/Zn/Cd) transporter
VHLLDQGATWDPFPPIRHFDVAAGWRWADAVAGLVVTGFILHVGLEVTRTLLQHLVDGIDPELLAAAKRAVLGVPGIAHAHVRPRWMGRSLIVEVEGFVPAGATVAAGEAIGRAVEGAVAAAVPESRAVLWCPRATPSMSETDAPEPISAAAASAQ